MFDAGFGLIGYHYLSFIFGFFSLSNSTWNQCHHLHRVITVRSISRLSLSLSLFAKKINGSISSSLKESERESGGVVSFFIGSCLIVHHGDVIPSALW